MCNIIVIWVRTYEHEREPFVREFAEKLIEMLCNYLQFSECAHTSRLPRTNKSIKGFFKIFALCLGFVVSLVFLSFNVHNFVFKAAAASLSPNTIAAINELF